MYKILNILLLLSIDSLLLAQSGQIGSDQTICYGSGPADLVFTTQPSVGTPPYSYRWQQSTDGINFTDISGRIASHSVYSPPVLGRTTWFRCMVTDNLSTVIGPTNSVSIIVRTALTAGRISGDQVVYAGTAPAALTEIEAPSGGGAGYTYQWQSSANGLSWSDIQGAVSAGYAPTALIADTWYRRLAINGSCGSTAGSPARIAVNPITMYTSEVPNGGGSYYGPQNIGTEFEVLTGGFITAVRLYSHVAEGGVHQIRLWRRNDQLTFDLVAGPFTWDFSAGEAGWREFPLSSAIAVEANRNYIVSVTTGVNNDYWVRLPNNLIPYTTNSFVRYIRGSMSSNMAIAPNDDSDGGGYFRDIVFIPFTPGSAGAQQSICYNNSPSSLSQITAPTGGSGTYSFQWESSPDGSTWTNIQGATSAGYSPPALTVSTYYRRTVTSGTITANCSPVLITVDAQFSLTQLQSTLTIFENTSTFLSVAVTGGTPPYRINYTRNGTPQTQILNYVSGAGIFTGVLPAGSYTYALTNVTDALGCVPQSLGSPVTVTVQGSHSGSRSNKALVIVNSWYQDPFNNNQFYNNYPDFIKPYLDWFGIPYDTCNISTQSLPDLNDYALIIFGHRAVYDVSYPAGQQYYPIAALEAAISGGVGLYSFDPHLFDFPSAFNTPGVYQPDAFRSRITINTGHYITQLHAKDEFNSENDTVYLNFFNGALQTMHIWGHSYDLVGSTNLATMDSAGYSEHLLEVANFGNGRIVKWSAYLWAFDDRLGPVKGMDDLVWRGLVWAARKPFVMQGVPPMITMRVDDVDGNGPTIVNNLEWLKISNEFGFIPWCGTFTMAPPVISTMRDLINNHHTTASPHAFATNEYIYYNFTGAPVFSAADSVIKARNIYSSDSLTMSKFMIPHAYLISSAALSEVKNMGIEYLGMHIEYDQIYNGSTNWLECGPYRINRFGNPAGQQPVFYAGDINWLGNDFFNCVTEIRDDGGYEWYPDGANIAGTINRGVRHLRRALNSMVLPTLFTHEFHLANITPSDWRFILGRITSAISSYNPEYKSMDDAVQYMRAKTHIRITNVTDDASLVNISCSGNNDMETRCYLFTESNNLITYRLVTLPMVTSTSTPVTVGVLK